MALAFTPSYVNDATLFVVATAVYLYLQIMGSHGHHEAMACRHPKATLYQKSIQSRYRQTLQTTIPCLHPSIPGVSSNQPTVAIMDLCKRSGLHSSI